MARARGNQRFHGTLPGGRAPYYGKDAYASQMNEYVFRRVNEFPGADEGQLITGVELALGTTNVTHALRRSYTGVIPLNIRARPSRFMARLITDQAVPGSTTALVEFDEIEEDVGGDFNTSTHLFTAPVNAWYEFQTTIRLDGTQADQYVYSIRFELNGSQLLIAESGALGQSLGALTQQAGVRVKLDAGDTFGVLYRHGNASGEDIRGLSGYLTFFQGEIQGQLVPYIDTGASVDTSRVIPIHAERPLTCDLWVY